MKFSIDLSARLDALTEALDDNGDDLLTIMSVLVDDLSVGITSLVGMSITVSADGGPVTVTALNSHTAATSMLLPLAAATAAPQVSHIVFYAQNPGAFTDLAADVRFALGLDGEIVLDGHLPPPTAVAVQGSLDVLADRSTVNQAIGFLIENGYPPTQARAELRRRAAAIGVSLPAIAQQILDAYLQPDPDVEGESDDTDERTG